MLETPKDPVKWPAYIFYFKPTLILWNAIPFGIFLLLFARVLDRYAVNDWTWFFCLIAAAFGTYLLPYTQTLNNHTIGAFSAFFALYQFLRIWDEGELAGWRFAAAGFFAGFTASTELPALAFPALLGPLLLVRYPRQTLLYFLPAAIIPAGRLRGRTVRRVRRVLPALRVVRVRRIQLRGEHLADAPGAGLRSTSTPSRTASTCST